jgi:hypothetical protein
MAGFQVSTEALCRGREMRDEYRLNSLTMAIEPEGGRDGRMHFVIIPAGGLLKVIGEPQQSGLVDVLF